MHTLCDDENEIWVNVYIDGVTYHKYLVSNKGRVFSILRNSIMKGTRYSSYVRIKLRTDDGKVMSKAEHRIVAESFCIRPKGKNFVNHIDGNKENNHPSNLEWVTCKENTKHAIDTGLLYTIGEKSHFASITEEKAHRICKFIDLGFKLTDISKLLNVGKDCVKKINRGHSWKHISSQYNFLK